MKQGFQVSFRAYAPLQSMIYLTYLADTFRDLRRMGADNKYHKIS